MKESINLIDKAIGTLIETVSDADIKAWDADRASQKEASDLAKKAGLPGKKRTPISQEALDAIQGARKRAEGK